MLFCPQISQALISILKYVLNLHQQALRMSFKQNFFQILEQYFVLLHFRFRHHLNYWTVINVLLFNSVHLNIKSEKKQIKPSFFSDLTFVNVAGVNIKVQGLGPLNWVWKMLVIGEIKKSIRMLLTLKLKEQLELSWRRESVIDRLYIPILERKFSRKY